MLRIVCLILGITAAVYSTTTAAFPASATEPADTTTQTAAAAHPPAAAAPIPTPSIGEQRDAYQRQLADVQDKLRQLAATEQQLRGAIAALAQFAPPPTPEGQP